MLKHHDVPSYETNEFCRKTRKYCICVFVINEGDKLLNQLDKMKEFCKDSVDIIVADGGSTDGSTEHERLKALGVNTLLVKTGPGKLGSQMRMAFDWALKRGYEGVIVVDGNGKDGMDAIPRFVEELDKGIDHVQGSRFIEGGYHENTPKSRLLGLKLLHAPLIRLASGFHYTDTTNGFRAYSARLLFSEKLEIFRDCFSGYELHYYLAIESARQGYLCSEIPVSRVYPAEGKTPTKISGFKGNFNVLNKLFLSCLRVHVPGESATEVSPAVVYAAFFCKVLALLFLCYLAVILIYTAARDNLNFDAAMNCCSAKSFAWGKGFVNRYFGDTPFFSGVTTGLPILLPLAFGIWLFGNGLSVPHMVMLCINLPLLALVLYLPLKYRFIGRKYWGFFALFYLAAYFLYPGIDGSFYWYYTPLGELPVSLLVQIGALMLFSDFNAGRVSRRTVFWSGVVFGTIIQIKEMGALPIVAVCGAWFWIRMRLFPRGGWRGLTGDVLTLLGGVALVPFLSQIFMFISFGCSPRLYWQNKQEFFQFFTGHAAAESGGGNSSLLRHIRNRFLLYRTVDGLTFALVMAVLPLYFAVRLLFVRTYRKEFFSWTLFFAGYSIYLHWLFLEKHEYLRHLLIGHILFLAACAFLLTQNRHRILQALFLALILLLNPQMGNATRDLFTFTRPEHDRETREIREVLMFCLQHPDAKFFGFDWQAPHLINYAHPETDNFLQRGLFDGSPDSYAIMENRYIEMYRDKLPPRAARIDSGNQYWTIYSLDKRADSKDVPRLVRPDDFTGDDISDILLYRTEENGGTEFLIRNIEGGELYAVQAPAGYGAFFGTGDVNSDGKTELLFHSDAAGTTRLTCVTPSDSDEVMLHALTFENDWSRSYYSAYFAADGYCPVVHSPMDGVLQYVARDGSKRGVPGGFTNVWKVMTVGYFVEGDSDQFLFHCTETGGDYLCAPDIAWKETRVGRPVIACGPVSPNYDTVFSRASNGEIALMDSTETLPVPSGWDVVAAGRFLPDRPLPQLLLRRADTGTAALWIGGGSGTVEELPWTIPDGWRVWNRIYWDGVASGTE